MTNLRVNNACRIFAGLICGPGAVAYVRQGSTIQTPSGPVAGNLELNFALALDHAVSILDGIETRIEEDNREKQRRNQLKAAVATREQELKTQGPGHCQHGIAWDEYCPDCRNGSKPKGY